MTRKYTDEHNIYKAKEDIAGAYKNTRLSNLSRKVILGGKALNSVSVNYLK